MDIAWQNSRVTEYALYSAKGGEAIVLADKQVCTHRLAPGQKLVCSV